MTENDIRKILKEVKDPEIPTISIVDLGIVTEIKLNGNHVFVELTPTFAGCPALKIMEKMVSDRLSDVEGIEQVEVKTSFEKQWSTDMISDEGHEALLKHGLTPPKRNCSSISMEVLEDTNCPWCGSDDTTLNSPFGPTLCRSMHYCNSCKQAFEGFKPVVNEQLS